MKKNFWHRLRRRQVIRAASYLLALVIVLGAAFIVADARAMRYELYIENDYQHAFTELVTAVEGIDSSLQKGVLATSPAMLTAICTDVYGKANAAAMSLGALPFSTVELEKTAGFINKVGDYALSVSRLAAAGETSSPEQQSNLKSLSDIASVLAQNLTELQTDIYLGSLRIGELYQAQQQLDSAEESQMSDSVTGGVSQIETEFPEIPSLIYDGPFSEHIEKREAKMLTGAETVTAEQAMETAAKFFDLRVEAFEHISDGEGKVKTYGYGAKVDGGEMYVEVTQAGGLVLSMFNSRAVTAQKLTADAAVKRAEQFLEDNGITGMQRSYYQINNNVLVANFAYTQNGVICYPDLIKVSVALDNGRIVGYEAAGYIAAHTERTLPEAAVTESEASGKLYSELTVLSHALAVIPTQGENEVLCHEFKCSMPDGRHYILYVNAQTGTEEKIMILLEDETGTLTV